MAQIRRGKDIHFFTPLDTLPYQPGRPEVNPHLHAMHCLVIGRDLRYHLPQAPWPIQHEFPPKTVTGGAIRAVIEDFNFEGRVSCTSVAVGAWRDR
jgi:hypothetical protein